MYVNFHEIHFQRIPTPPSDNKNHIALICGDFSYLCKIFSDMLFWLKCFNLYYNNMKPKNFGEGPDLLGGDVSDVTAHDASSITESTSTSIADNLAKNRASEEVMRKFEALKPTLWVEKFFDKEKGDYALRACTKYWWDNKYYFEKIDFQNNPLAESLVHEQKGISAGIISTTGIVFLTLQRGTDTTKILCDHPEYLYDLREIVKLAYELLECPNVEFKMVEMAVKDCIEVIELHDMRMTYTRDILPRAIETDWLGAYTILHPQSGEIVPIGTEEGGHHFVAGETADGKQRVVIYNRWLTTTYRWPNGTEYDGAREFTSEEVSWGKVSWD